MQTKIQTSLSFHDVHAVKVNKVRCYDRSTGGVFHATEIVLYDSDNNPVIINLFGDNAFKIEVM